MFLYLTRLLALIMLCILAGCAHELNPSPPPAPKASTTGAIIGAVGGAMASPPVAVAVAMGSVTGAAIGHMLDQRQPLTLPKQITNSGIQLNQVGDQITLILPADQFFEYESPAMKPYSFTVLNTVVAYVAQAKKDSVKVIAYTDKQGMPQRSFSLSETQAQNMARYLWSHGIDARLLYAAGRGECCSVASNDSEKGRALNRRIEISFQMV